MPRAADVLRASFGKAQHKSGIPDVTFNGLRRTAATRLAFAGCSEAEIATITGHGLRDGRSILDSHYLNRASELGRGAIARLE
jgi:integrase